MKPQHFLDTHPVPVHIPTKLFSKQGYIPDTNIDDGLLYATNAHVDGIK